MEETIVIIGCKLLKMERTHRFSDMVRDNHPRVFNPIEKFVHSLHELLTMVLRKNIRRTNQYPLEVHLESLRVL